jgi:hypothetical protein
MNGGREVFSHTRRGYELKTLRRYLKAIGQPTAFSFLGCSRFGWLLGRSVDTGQFVVNDHVILLDSWRFKRLLSRTMCCRRSKPNVADGT